MTAKDGQRNGQIQSGQMCSLGNVEIEILYRVLMQMCYESFLERQDSQQN